MSNKKTWKVLRWDNEPEQKSTIELCCPRCQTDAVLTVGDDCGALIIAAVGLSLVFDPPGHVPPANFMPNEIQCRNCRRIWSD